jgi:hypothetical protein
MKKIMFNSLPLLLTIVIGLIVWSYYMPNQRKYVMVDVDLISRHFVAKLLTMNLEEEKYQRLLAEYDRTLETVIEKIGNKNHFVIFKRSAILTKLPDITSDIEEIVFKELRL